MSPPPTNPGNLADVNKTTAGINKAAGGSSADTTAGTKSAAAVDDQLLLRKSVESAWLNILASVFFRLFTFVANAYILRRVTRDVLGVGVRTTLLFDTVLFLSREAFRKACLSRPDNGEWRGITLCTFVSTPSAVTSLF